MTTHDPRAIPGPERIPHGMRFGMQIAADLPEWQAPAYARKILRTKDVTLVRGYYPIAQDQHGTGRWGPLSAVGWTAYRE